MDEVVLGIDGLSLIIICVSVCVACVVMVLQLLKRAVTMSNSTNNNDNAAKTCDLDLSEFMELFKNTKICDSEITFDELFKLIGQYIELKSDDDRHLRASCQGGIR